jgi:hypothetical protein
MTRNRTTNATKTRPPTKMARVALLTLGAKKATELWRSRQQPPPPSLMQRLAIPARVLLAALGVGGAAYIANKKGLLGRIKQGAGKGSPGVEKAAAFTTSGAGAGADAPPPMQPTEPPGPIVDTHAAPTVTPGSPRSTV